MFCFYEGKKIYYETHGEGKPLLILNGIMMSTASWTEFIEPFSAEHQLILMDMFDQGQSEKLEGNDQYTHALQAEAIRTVLETVGVENADVFGVSYGGMAAMQLTLQYPHLVGRLILANTASETTYWLQEICHGWNASLHDPLDFYLTTIPYIYSPMFFIEHREWMEDRKKKLVQVFSNPVFTHAMSRLTLCLTRYNNTERMGEIKVPTLIIGSQYDMITPEYQLRQLNKDIKNSTLMILPDCGHASMYEKPDAFVSSVLGFFGYEKRSYAL